MRTYNYKMSDFQNLKRKSEESFDYDSAISAYNRKYISKFSLVAIMLSACGLAYSAIRESISVVKNNNTKDNMTPRFFDGDKPRTRPQTGQRYGYGPEKSAIGGQRGPRVIIKKR